MPAPPLLRPMPMPLPVASLPNPAAPLVLTNPFRPPWIYVLLCAALAPFAPPTDAPPHTEEAFGFGVLAAAIMTLWVVLFPGR